MLLLSTSEKAPRVCLVPEKELSVTWVLRLELRLQLSGMMKAWSVIYVLQVVQRLPTWQME